MTSKTERPHLTALIKKSLAKSGMGLFGRILVSTVLALLFLSFLPSSAHAMPPFARKHNIPCSFCHTAWPLLNGTGRQFKENGYRFFRGEESGSIISDVLQFDEDFPLGVIVKSRPYDKKESGDSKLRAIHEIELFMAGPIYENISGHIEIEAEDENDFIPEASGSLTYHHSELFNFQASYGSLLVADPYDTLSAARRLTRGRNSLIDQRFGGADNNGRLRDARQTIALYGRPIDWVYYSIGHSGVAKDAEGVQASNFHMRLALDVLDDITIGGLVVFGECKSSAGNCAIDRNFTRFGLDFQGRYEDVVLHGGYMQAKDDFNFAGPFGIVRESKNEALYIEGLYTFRTNGRPLIVPLLRVDRFEQNNGVDHFTEITTNLSYYLTENVRIFAEWWKQVDVPSGQFKDGRVTIQIEMGF